jgi:hypothetical protein
VQYNYFSFEEDMNMLVKIPLIPALLETAGAEASGMTTAQVSDAGKTSPTQERREMTRSDRDGDQQLEDREGNGECSQQVQQNDQPVTLLQWISANNQSNVHQVAQMCMRDLEQVRRITNELLSQSYFMIDSQYVLVSGTPLEPMARYYFFLSFARKLLCSSSWCALSDETTDL